MSNDLPIVSFTSAKEWEKWLAKNHLSSDGVWLCLQKKSSPKQSPTYAEALDVALCFGWIDGQKKSHDEFSWIQRFTRRRPRSMWSKRNTEHVERLIQSKRMKASGFAEVLAAKKDGRWKAAYESSKNSAIPDDFLRALSKNKIAQATFKTLNKANLYAISYRLQTAKKPETRERRMKVILETLSKGEKFH